MYRDFHRAAWACGVLVALLLFLFSSGIAHYLKLPSRQLVNLIAIGAAFYVPLGTRRGYIQGAFGFRNLATNLILEGLVRLFGSLLLMWLGYGVDGVIAANAAAMAVAYFAAAPKLAARVPSQLRLSYAMRESLQAMVFFAGQVIINNCDIVLVKHFFTPPLAGLYAAVAMVGRVIFALCQAVVNSMFPLVAGTREEERKDLRVIATSLLLVLTIGSVIALTLRLMPAFIWAKFFGAGFGVSGPYGLPYLLALYAVTTIIYTLSVVMITYEMSYKIANTSWVQLAFSGVVIAGICRFHSSLREVIMVQLVLMIGLLIFVALPFLISSLTDSRDMQPSGTGRPVKALWRVSEDEVIAEFLKSEFRNPAFRMYQDSMQGIVNKPNLEDAAENQKRRALLFIRHLALWKELPEETIWYEVEIREQDLDQIRVFPRAQWLNLARGNFSITEVAERMRVRQTVEESAFLSKIDHIRERLQDDEDNLGTVILIGVNEDEPFTILDGNHRMVASMLATPRRVQKLRFLCGLSPRMKECCWYNTNLVTLSRYGRNVIKHALRDPEAELARLLESPG